MSLFSFSRWWAIVIKEFIQLKRDRLTFGMIVGIPIIQLLLFGFAINTDPKHLPTAVIISEQSEFTRSFVSGMVNTGYFDIKKVLSHEKEGHDALKSGEVLFVLNIPADFSRHLVRGENPSLLLQADATDPIASGNAVNAVSQLANLALNRELDGTLYYLLPDAPPFNVNVQRMYNPEGITQYNIVPGLMGVILTMTMVMMTGLAITRERERGTMENMLASPVRPLEVMCGKLVPFILVGLLQSTLIIFAAYFIFAVPFFGSLTLLYLATLTFIAANLTVGITMSALAQNQLQALQMTFFFFLPSLLLSGFMFPFYGMPQWAQMLGSVLPMTHYLRIIRGIILKGNGLADIWPSTWPILLFTLIVMAIGTKFYRKTLD